MARIRTVKPEFWSDDRLSDCSYAARLLFIATWNFADDAGGLDRSAKQLKAQAFPYDKLNVEPLIQELLGAGCLLEYEVDGKKYLHIKNFRKHQRIDRPQAPRVPPYDSTNGTRILDERSTTIRGGSDRIGSEGKGSDLNGSDPIQTRARAESAQPVDNSGGRALAPERLTKPSTRKRDRSPQAAAAILAALAEKGVKP